MVASFGQLQALHQLGLLNRTRYISGVSGGSWSTHAFAYYQRGAPGVAKNDDEFHCGDIKDPSLLSTATLAALSATCSRAIATKGGGGSSSAVHGSASSGPIPAKISAASIKQLWEFTLAKVGIPLQGHFSYSAATVAEILARKKPHPEQHELCVAIQHRRRAAPLPCGRNHSAGPIRTCACYGARSRYAFVPLHTAHCTSAACAGAEGLASGDMSAHPRAHAAGGFCIWRNNCYQCEMEMGAEGAGAVSCLRVG